MTLHFEPSLDYQMQAIEAVCNLFGGQGKTNECRVAFAAHFGIVLAPSRNYLTRWRARKTN